MTRAAYRAPSKELVDRFVAALNARDIERVTKLLLDNTTLDVYGIGSERGTGMTHYRDDPDLTWRGRGPRRTRSISIGVRDLVFFYRDA